MHFTSSPRIESSPFKIFGEDVKSPADYWKKWGNQCGKFKRAE